MCKFRYLILRNSYLNLTCASSISHFHLVIRMQCLPSCIDRTHHLAYQLGYVKPFLIGRRTRACHYKIWGFIRCCAGHSGSKWLINNPLNIFHNEYLINHTTLCLWWVNQSLWLSTALQTLQDIIFFF